jgi:hypothetical protein
MRILTAMNSIERGESRARNPAEGGSAMPTPSKVESRNWLQHPPAGAVCRIQILIGRRDTPKRFALQALRSRAEEAGALRSPKEVGVVEHVDRFQA